MATTPAREPIEFAAGDTLKFTRVLPDYLPSDGWSLTYELRGGTDPIEFTSVAENGGHTLSVAASVTAAWLPGEYVLAGYASDGTNRHQIYYGQLTVTPNLPTTAGDAPQKTFAQQMVEAWEDILLKGGTNDLVLSQVGGQSRFEYMTAMEKAKMHGYWKVVRANEIQKERAKAGLPTGNKIKPLFRVKSPSISVTRQYIGGYGGW